MYKHLLNHLFCTLLFLFIISGNTVACTGRDIVFTSITVTSITGSNYQYSYQIQNIGTVGIAFKQLIIQNYVSADDTYDVSDQAAGGTTINPSSLDTLVAGATYNGTMTVYAGSHSQSSYPYIVAHVYVSTDPECDDTNNYLGVLIQVTAGLAQNSNVANATVNWNTDSKSFIVNEWSGNSSALKYSVYSISGNLLFTGNTQKNESTPLFNLSNGMYILYLSDGEKIYSQKIAY